MIEEIHSLLFRFELIIIFISFTIFSFRLWSYLLQEKKVPEIFLYANAHLKDKHEMIRLNNILYLLYGGCMIVITLLPSTHLVILVLMPTLYTKHVLQTMYIDNIKVLKQVRIDIDKIKK